MRGAPEALPGMGTAVTALKVLLVDDSGLSRKVQAKVLREVGVDEILEAKNGLDALRQLKELRFQVGLLVTDWNMPGMDGIALIEEVRRATEGRNLPIMVISSEGEEDKISQALASGANSYVTKPFKKEVLARKIQAVRWIADLQDQKDRAGQGGPPPLMEGDLERLGFAELVGFLNFSKKTGELIVALETGEAGVAFHEGEVHDAWIGRFASEEAFYAIARLKHGRFRFNEGGDRGDRPRRVKQSTVSLLMEAMRLLDEEQQQAAGG
ncbi:MAG: response regulator [Planctomycetes bacterium]|nr:response regulator [Planctomycetota bacterium]